MLKSRVWFSSSCTHDTARTHNWTLYSVLMIPPTLFGPLLNDQYIIPVTLETVGDFFENLYCIHTVYIVACWVCHATNNFALSGCSKSLMIYHSYTVQLLSLYNSTVPGRQL
jgi:hypothetical protein